MTLLRTLFLLLCALPLCASSVSYARAELDAAFAARGLPNRIKAELDDLPADSFKIELTRIRGADVRGLMYGLLEAAAQIRATGKLRAVTATPANAVRGAKMSIGADSLPDTAEYWQSLFQLLARARFNRFQLALDTVPEARILAPIAQAAADYSIDFVLGLNQPQYESLKAALAVSPSIRAIQIPAASDDATRAASEAGRRVLVEIRDAPGLAKELEITRDYDKAAVLAWGRQSYGDPHEDVVPRPARPAAPRPKAPGAQ